MAQKIIITCDFCNKEIPNNKIKMLAFGTKDIDGNEVIENKLDGCDECLKKIFNMQLNMQTTPSKVVKEKMVKASKGKSCPRHEWTKKEISTLIERYNQGKSYEAIAKEFGMSNSMVNRKVVALQKNGVIAKDKRGLNKRLSANAKKQKVEVTKVEETVVVDNSGFVQSITRPHGKTRENARLLLIEAGINGTVDNVNYNNIHFTNSDGVKHVMNWKGEVTR